MRDKDVTIGSQPITCKILLKIMRSKLTKYPLYEDKITFNFVSLSIACIGLTNLQTVNITPEGTKQAAILR